MYPMKAISMHQPHASLFAAGLRFYETRSWFPDHGLVGQQIAIHAARYVDKANTRLAEEILSGKHGHDVAAKVAAVARHCPDDLMGRFGKVMMPVGCIICLVTLDAAFELGELADGTAHPASHVLRRISHRDFPLCFSVRHDAFGDFSPGRWAWLLQDPKPLDRPVKMIGKQRFFDLPQGWLAS